MGRTVVPMLIASQNVSYEDAALSYVREEYAHDRVDLDELEQLVAQILEGRRGLWRVPVFPDPTLRSTA